MQLSKSQKAIFALILANMIWGAAPPIFKWALSDIHPYTLALLRFAIPPLIMLPFVRQHLKVNKKDYLNVIFAGFLGITVNISFFFQGLLKAPSINAALIASSAPIFLILYSLVFLKNKEKPKKKLVTGSFIGLIGVIIVLGAPFILDGKIAVVGNVYYFIAMLGSATAVIIMRKMMKRNNPYAITFWTFLTGMVGFIPFFIKEVGQYGFLPNINLQGLAGLGFGIFLSSLVAYFFQTYALKYLSAADVGVFTYIDPVITILVAAPLLGEFPDTTFVIGSVMVILGILLAEGRLHYHPFLLFLKK